MHKKELTPEKYAEMYFYMSRYLEFISERGTTLYNAKLSHVNWVEILTINIPKTLANGTCYLDIYYPHRQHSYQSISLDRLKDEQAGLL